MIYDELALEPVDMATIDEQTMPGAFADRETRAVLSDFDSLDSRLLRIIRELDR